MTPDEYAKRLSTQNNKAFLFALKRIDKMCGKIGALHFLRTIHCDIIT